jgi:hypothetical protein
MYGLPPDVLLRSGDRVPVDGWTRTWLIDGWVATAEERDRALAPGNAAAWLRWSGQQASEELVWLLESGRVLLVLDSPCSPALDVGSPAVDLRDLQEAEPLSPAPAKETNTIVDEELSFIDVVLVDVLGQPRAGVLYELVLPDATVFSGRTASDGRLRLDGLSQKGDCELTFPELAA